ncbi:MAG: acetyl-CoA C-acyltransferase, partial [Microcella sp.]
ARLTAVDLGMHAARAALDRSGLPADAIQAAIFGQVLPAGCGQNPSRQVALSAGLHPSVATSSVNSVCLSGARAIADAARLIRLGDADAVLAGGMESMTNAPHLLSGVRLGWVYGSQTALDHVAYDGLTDAADGISMGESTERHVGELGISRVEQDEVAAASHQRAAAAANDGRLAAEIAPVEITSRGGTTVVDNDEGVRADSTAETLARLRPAFTADGTITAGNASPLSDGAAAVVVAREDWAREQGAAILARVVGWGEVAGPDNSLHSQPSRAIMAALDRVGWGVSDLDHIEINEAFAAVSIQSTRDLGVDPSIVNPDGGAIALGHPIGASGARLVAHAAHAIHNGRARRAAISLCGGGGQGQSLLLEAV